MLFVSGHSPNFSLTYRVYDFFSEIYEVSADVEVCHTILRDELALGFTEVNGDEQFIQIHNGLNREEFIVTLLHELVHVVQNEKGMIDETEREEQAYNLEGILYNEFLHSSEQQCVPQVLVSQ